MKALLFLCLVLGLFALPALQNSTASNALGSHQTQDSIVGSPTITADFINRELASYGSPAAGTGQDLYSLGVQFGIDPAYALAFFQHESQYGTTGEARTTLSLGNERCISDRPCIDQDRGGYAQMDSWIDGYRHWYTLMLYGYVRGGINKYIGRNACPCLTLPQIIAIYAPSSDGNNEQSYVSAVEAEIAKFRRGTI